MKKITWLGNTLQVVKTFPKLAKQEAGYGLDNVQHGAAPKDWKPMPSIGPGVKEIRVHAQGEFRIIYIAKFTESIYVLHAFQKKTLKTAKKDIDLAKARLKEVLQTKGGAL